MTYDELLKKLSSTNRRYAGSQDNAALRAVVELHSPSKSLMTSEVGCTGCGYNSEYSTWEFEWPCPTIQAIEKELG